ncbi:MAG: Gfo/Idh/MocA family oxidoreductase [Acidimicrobiales bacterium]|nr:Gfo/Idh/MocA family oxidoreductase [Acidimicrobiales bacterium]
MLELNERHGTSGLIDAGRDAGSDAEAAARRDLLGVAVIGAGYWGPNLVRNLASVPEMDLRWVCDLDRAKAQQVVGRYSSISVTSSLDDVLADPRVSAVAIATPAGTHAELVERCLRAGRHVLVEKPLALQVADAERLVELAQQAGLVLMCDHTYCYTAAVSELRRLLHSGEVGSLQFIDSVRINLGLVQPDADVLWDLAPHDLSILENILPPDVAPIAVSAQGSDPIGAGKACVAYLNLRLSNGAIAHLHANWLSPIKVRTVIVGGSRRMVVWDDLNPAQLLSVYDRGVDLQATADARRVSYRTGDMSAPALSNGEALRGVAVEFLRSIRERRTPLTDGRAGLRVLRVLDAASRSLAEHGREISLEGAW